MYKNRIINFGTKPADQFMANPDNFRVHPEEQQQVVHNLLSEVGWVGVVIEGASGYVLDGHERIWEALQDGSEVPYIQVDLSPEEERLILAAFDASGRMADIDQAKASRIVAELRLTAPRAQLPIVEAVAIEYELSPVAALPQPAGSGGAHERRVACPACGHVFDPNDI